MPHFDTNRCNYILLHLYCKQFDSDWARNHGETSLGLGMNAVCWQPQSSICLDAWLRIVGEREIHVNSILIGTSCSLTTIHQILLWFALGHPREPLMDPALHIATKPLHPHPQPKKKDTESNSSTFNFSSLLARSWLLLLLSSITWFT